VLSVRAVESVDVRRVNSGAWWDWWGLHTQSDLRRQ